MLVDRVWHGQHAQAAAARRSQRHVLRARSHQRQVPLGDAVRLPELEHGLRREGRPIAVPGSNSSPEGSFFVYPTLGGGTNFQAPSYSPLTGWLYLAYPRERPAVRQRAATFEAGPAVHRPHAPRRRRRRSRASRAVGRHQGDRSGEPARRCGISRLFQGSLTNGVLATAGDVVFAAIRDGNLVALDARTGTPCGTSRPARSDRSVADELRGRRPPVRRGGRRQHGLQLRAARMTKTCIRRRALCVRAAAAAGCAVLGAQHGDVVQLEDATTQTVVSIAPSVGNIAFEMKVKGRTCCAGRSRRSTSSRPSRR